MANLTVKPTIKPIKVEVFNNLSLERADNSFDMKSSSKSKLLGAPLTQFVNPKNDTRNGFWDNFLNPQEHKPYVVAITCVVESPMKLNIQN